MKSALVVVTALWTMSLVITSTPRAGEGPLQGPARGTSARMSPHADGLFQTSHDCIACHNGLTSASGENVSIGAAWRASMMANSARDPYWQASVAREMRDHPAAVDDIADECTICHMPMARARAKAGGRKPGAVESDALAADGVSCTLCHQIGSDRLGSPASFTGGFSLAFPTSGAPRTMFGPFEVDAGQTSVMRSATGVTPTEAPHVQQAELCATCHTLYTKALGANGQVVGSLPEQVPYLEWRHSAFSDPGVNDRGRDPGVNDRGRDPGVNNARSCQSCHMPDVDHPTPIASVLGEPRAGLSRHTFLGGNFFMLRMLDRYRTDLHVEAPAPELDESVRSTIRQLQSDTATVSIPSTALDAGRLRVDVAVSNLTGHKLPTGYPSRRAWLHLTVRDRAGRTVFESGAVEPSGAIRGNDHDVDGARVEPHYREITSADQVQIYESVMADLAGRPTTGLLSATAFIKDNRLLPRGFNKATAADDIAVRGTAAADDDFDGSGDRLRYIVDVTSASPPFDVEVEVRYQPIAYRWAENLKSYPIDVTRRFVSLYEAMAGESSVVVAHAAAHVTANTH
jgi:cytochrome c554/c'-like protein